jgi:hypothetical protein
LRFGQIQQPLPGARIMRHEIADEQWTVTPAYTAKQAARVASLARSDVIC